MASGGFFRGTSIDQDSRFFNQTKRLLAKMTFPPSFSEKVDVSKVKREVINQWITERITQLLGFEDDIVVSMVINLLEPKVDERLDPKQLQIAITGFLEKDAPAFVEELWGLLLSAQSHPTGIPTQILEKKKLEMAQLAKDKEHLRSVLDRKRGEVTRIPIETTADVQLGHGTLNRDRDLPGQIERDSGRGQRGRAPRRFDARGSRSPPRARARCRSRSRSQRRDARSRGRPRSPSRSRERMRERAHSRSSSRSRDSRRHSQRRSPSSSLERDRGSKRSDRFQRSDSLSQDNFGRVRRRSNARRSSSASRYRNSLKPQGRSASASESD